MNSVFFTASVRIPLSIGLHPVTGRALPGGPYKLPQIIGAASSVAVGYVGILQGFHPHVLATLALVGVVVSYVGLKHLPSPTHNPLIRAQGFVSHLGDLIIRRTQNQSLDHETLSPPPCGYGNTVASKLQVALKQPPQRDNRTLSYLEGF